MKKLLLSILFSFTALSAETTVQWDSDEGLARMESCQVKANYWKLLRFYECQSEGYCGIASAVMAFNALGIQDPNVKFLGKYPLFTQENFFTDKVHAVINQPEMKKRGLSLDDLSIALSTFTVNIQKYEACHLMPDEMRSILISALSDPNQCVLALYYRKELSQLGGGHWSPIAAYDEKSDSFLILDVARFKYPPTWVDASSLFQAVQTKNNAGKSRGFIVLKTLI